MDRSSYVNRTRTKEMRSSIIAWAFPDTGAQVTLINPAMVAAMGGANLITPKSLQIKDAGNHLMETEGAFSLWSLARIILPDSSGVLSR